MAECFGGAGVGDTLGPLAVPISTAANERYWRAAGVDHPRLREGALYPPIAANLTIMLFQTVARRPLLHTAQRLVSYRRGDADVELTVTGLVAELFEKRGREYAVVEADIALPDGSALWSSVATFTEAAR